MADRLDPFRSRTTLSTPHGAYARYDLLALERAGLGRLSRLPYSLRVLLESLLRHLDEFVVHRSDVEALMAWDAKRPAQTELPFFPGRVVLQDFTGVPCMVDLAAMRDAMKALGGDPKAINPAVPCDLVIDHSVQVDWFGSADALRLNVEKEFERNRERYEFLKWGQKSLDNFRVVPPATGIIHQVNLEYLSPGVLTRRDGEGPLVAFPDSLVGTDSHTTMINGLGVVGWGVGGIEAEAVMLGQPVYMVTPEVIGVRLTGRLAPGATATDLVLTVTEILRKRGVVEKFVEFTGPGMADLSLTDRATIANMAPEYGATMGFFPVDARTLEYLAFTGRDPKTVELVEAYTRANGMFWTADAPEPEFTDLLHLDLSKVVPSLAGPKRPQDRIDLGDVKQGFREALTQPPSTRGLGVAPDKVDSRAVVAIGPGVSPEIGHGAVVIAAITSCTNTSNPDLMIAAGLVARKAFARGLNRKPWVKTSLAPGSRVVTDYLDKAGLTKDLDALGFQTVGYGCTTCIGNSGPLPDEVAAAVKDGDLVVASVLSGNRNFEGRVHAQVKANYLASPPLCVAYALAGTIDRDLLTEPIGVGSDGREVFLKEIWPTTAEVAAVRERALSAEQFRTQYGKVFEGTEAWRRIPVAESELYAWDETSTYIQNPPFFIGMKQAPPGVIPVQGARVLAFLGDSVTTDHISPAGSIAKDSPAARYLIERGVQPADFNSYGSRRGNDRIMTRGTFANIRVRNKLAGGKEGGYTKDMSRAGAGAIAAIFDAAQNYKAEGTPLVVLAGKDYGMGSSRDWAAKGTFLLGVRAVIAESFERIHRSNLVGMGILPLTFPAGKSAESLGLDGTEVFDLGLPSPLTPRCTVGVTATKADGTAVRFDATCRLDTPVEIVYYGNGGILQTVLRKKLEEQRTSAH